MRRETPAHSSPLLAFGSPAAPTEAHHTAFSELPVVDVAGLRSADARIRAATAAELGRAAREVGFLYVSGHGVPAALCERLQQQAKRYFAQPLETKLNDHIARSCNHSGYVPEGEEQFAGGSVDRKEAYDIGFELDRSELARPMLGCNQWPPLAGFREDVAAYFDAVLALGNLLFRGFAIALGLPEVTFVRLASRPPSQLRLIHYPHDESSGDRRGIGAHTDYECFTILLPTAPGLEVLNGAGQWIDAPPVPGTFIINIGDMLEIMSNGIFVATAHRVRRVAEERYAFPLFCACDYDTVIAPVPALATTGSRYEPLVCGDHLYAQTVQTFGYLKQRLARGELQLPATARALGSFGPRAASEGLRNVPGEPA